MPVVMTYSKTPYAQGGRGPGCEAFCYYEQKECMIILRKYGKSLQIRLHHLLKVRVLCR